MTSWCISRRGSALAGSLWVLLGLWGLTRVPSDQWRWRDDAVITLSHARGLAEFGYPAVSATAERVEGTSAPLQMFVAAVFYRFGGSGWETFLDAQVVVGFALSGWFVARTLHAAFPRANTPTVVVAAGAVALVGFSTWPALGWFGSGMENSVVVPLLFAVVACSVGALVDDHHRGWAAGAAFGLAGIARVELAAFLLPALVLVATMLWRGRREVAARILAITLLCWAGVHLWRYRTFGSFVPNTAIAQDKASIDIANVALIATVALLCGGVMWCWQHSARRATAAASITTAGSIALAIESRSGSATSWGGLPTALVLGSVAMVVIAAAGWIIGVSERRVWIVVLAVGFVPIAQHLVLGPARLDDSRISAQSLPLLAIVVGIVLVHLATAPITSPGGPGTTSPHSQDLGSATVRTLLAGVVMACGVTFAAMALSTASTASSHRYLCCEISWYTSVLDEAEQHRLDHELPRVIVATADLGKYSFDKTVIVVDLGDLGDAVMAELRHRRPDLIAGYLDRVQPPDVVETHGTWVCSIYRDWFRSDGFSSRYDLSRLDDRPGGIDRCLHDGDFQYYRRSDRDAEYSREVALAAALATTPDRGVDLVEDAARTCADPSDPLSSQWIRRAIQRAGPELRNAGTFDGAVDALGDHTATAELDRLLLTTPPGWARRATDVIIAHLDDVPPAPAHCAHQG